MMVSAWILTGLIVCCAFIGAPLFLVLFGVVGVWTIANYQVFETLQLILIELNRLSAVPVLAVLPLFTLAGTLITATNAPKRIMALMRALFGWMPGGMVLAALVTSAFFTALTGASGVTIMALGGVLYPILRRQAFDRNFSLGLVTTAGGMGILFPPSLPLILFGVVAQVDIARLFRVALIPGIALMVVIFCYGMVRDRMRKRVNTVRPKFSLNRLGWAFYGARWDLPVGVILVAGVYGGIATVTETAVLVVAYIIFTACWVLKEISFRRQLPRLMVEGVVLSGAVILILGAAMGLTGLLVDLEVPARVLQSLQGVTSNKWAFLAGLNLFLLVVGCVMDIFSAIMVIVPMVVPIALEYGIDPFHLGVIFLINMEIGYSTPPVGMNLFIANLKFNTPMTRLYKASVPYLVLLFGVLILVTYWPQILFISP